MTKLKVSTKETIIFFDPKSKDMNDVVEIDLWPDDELEVYDIQKSFLFFDSLHYYQFKHKAFGKEYIGSIRDKREFPIKFEE